MNLRAQEIVDLGQNTINGHAPNNDTEVGQVAENKRKRTILLNSASDDFTKKFSEWWKQGNHTFKFQADGDFFRIWVSDNVRPENIELEARSTGLQWFFSFYLVFLVEAQSKHQNAILLLDEPGLTLHPVAQRDLFVFFENLATNNQILYTTHSPFMIDSNHLERVRSVYVEDTGKTVVSPDLRAVERKSNKNQTQSVFAVHAALGLTVSDTLLINCNSILVEGESDQHLLSALKIMYIANGIIKPTKEMVFIPTGGTKGIKTTAGILTGVHERKPWVVIDGDPIGKKVYNELKADFFSDSADRLLCIDEYTSVPSGEIEDLFPLEGYSRIISRFLPRPSHVEEDFEAYAKTGRPICKQAEEYAEQHDIQLEKGWKVKVAILAKRELLKSENKLLRVSDPEYAKLAEFMKKLSE